MSKIDAYFGGRDFDQKMAQPFLHGKNVKLLGQSMRKCKNTPRAPFPDNCSPTVKYPVRQMISPDLFFGMKVIISIFTLLRV